MYPKKVINYLHYDKENNKIVEPIQFATSGFDHEVEVNVRKSTDFSIYTTTFLRYAIFRNFYFFYIDHVHIPDTGAGVQDVIVVDFPFNDPNGPAPFNPTGFVISYCGDTPFVLNGDNRAGTIELGIIGDNILLIWPDKVLNSGQIPANADVHFGNSCFMVAMFNNNI